MVLGQRTLKIQPNEQVIQFWGRGLGLWSAGRRCMWGSGIETYKPIQTKGEKTLRRLNAPSNGAPRRRRPLPLPPNPPPVPAAPAGAASSLVRIETEHSSLPARRGRSPKIPQRNECQSTHIQFLYTNFNWVLGVDDGWTCGWTHLPACCRPFSSLDVRFLA